MQHIRLLCHVRMMHRILQTGGPHLVGHVMLLNGEREYLVRVRPDYNRPELLVGRLCKKRPEAVIFVIDHVLNVIGLVLARVEAIFALEEQWN